MLTTLFRFELRFRLRQPAVYVFSLVFALLMWVRMRTRAAASLV